MKKLTSLLLALCMLLTGAAFAAPEAPAALPLAEGMTITAAVTHNTASVSDLVDNEFTKWMEEQTGVKLEITPLAEDVLAEKLMLMLNSGSYPQMICAAIKYSDLERYGVEEGILRPITDLIASDGYYYNMVAERYPVILEGLTMSDGNIYGMTGVQRPFHGIEQAGKLYVNTAWLDALGLEMPTTTDEFADMLRAFKTGDPNGNGIADEIPMSGSDSWNSNPHLMLMNAFCHFVGSRALMFDNGEFKPIYSQDGFKDGLKYIATLYGEGLIDPAAYTQTDAMMTALVDADTGLVGALNLGHLYMSQAMGSPVNKDWEMCLPLTGPNGYQGVPYNDTMSVSNAYVTFTDKLSDDELKVAFQWADLLFSDEGSLREMWGVKGEQWDYVDPSNPGTTMTNEPAEFELLENMHGELNNLRWNIQGCGQNDFNTRFAVRADIYSNGGSEARLGQQSAALAPYYDDYKYPTFKATGETAEELALIETALFTSYKEWVMQFITGAKSVDTDWDAFLADMDSLQIDTYIELTTKAYEDFNASK
ncbi:MAG: extracellular solute-binding protein [Candidatus Fimadaptatus sp.]